MQVKFCNTEDQDDLEISPICQEIREMRRAFTLWAETLIRLPTYV
jgi:hypothetical protein